MIYRIDFFLNRHFFFSFFSRISRNNRVIYGFIDIKYCDFEERGVFEKILEKDTILISMAINLINTCIIYLNLLSSSIIL